MDCSIWTGIEEDRSGISEGETEERKVVEGREDEKAVG
jgi:hypothetical protein